MTWVKWTGGQQDLCNAMMRCGAGRVLTALWFSLTVFISLSFWTMKFTSTSQSPPRGTQWLQLGISLPPHRRQEQARSRYSSFPGFIRLSENSSHLGSGKSFFWGQVLLGRTECSGVFENGYCPPPSNGNRRGFSPYPHYSPIFTIFSPVVTVRIRRYLGLSDWLLLFSKMHINFPLCFLVVWQLNFCDEFIQPLVIRGISTSGTGWDQRQKTNKQLLCSYEPVGEIDDWTVSWLWG